MNFSPFGSHFPSTLPSIHQFAAKFPHDPPTTTTTTTALSPHPQAMPPPSMITAVTDGARFLRPDHTAALPVAHLGSPAAPPTGMAEANKSQDANKLHETGKYLRSGSSGALPTHAQLASLGIATLGTKYTHVSVASSAACFSRAEEEAVRSLTYTHPPTTSLVDTSPASSSRPAKKGAYEQDLQPQDLCETILKDAVAASQELMGAKGRLKVEVGKKEDQLSGVEQRLLGNDDRSRLPPPSPWPNLPGPAQAAAVNEYLARFPPPSTIPLSLHQFLKYSAESMKKAEGHLLPAPAAAPLAAISGVEPLKPPKRKKKKKPPKEKQRPRAKPGEIQITTALDGSVLYCCPQCHVAYTDKEQLEQHMLGHKLERPYVCDLCGAGLKRKEHLDRHKQGHSGERPYVCSVCLKAFKRNEHLSRHYCIHSGDKNHLCTQCGKAFSRKDHLAKHAHTHLAKRVKAEHGQGGTARAAVATTVEAPHALVS